MHSREQTLTGRKVHGYGVQVCVVVAGKAVVAITRDEQSAGQQYSFCEFYPSPPSANVIFFARGEFTSTSITFHIIHNERSSPAADPAQVLFPRPQRSAHTLAEGKGLKKTQVNDRSAPQVAGSVGGAAAASASSNAGANAAPRPPAPAVPSGNDPASQLAGLFAGGMPTLRKTGDRAACQYGFCTISITADGVLAATGNLAKPPPIPSASRAPSKPSKPSAPPPPPPGPAPPGRTAPPAPPPPPAAPPAPAPSRHVPAPPGRA